MQTIIQVNSVNMITFVDLKKEIREGKLRDTIINKIFAGKSIVTNRQFDKLSDLDLSGEPITDLTGLEDIKQLKTLRLKGASFPVLDITPYQTLESLSAEDCCIVELIAGNENLKTLTLKNNKIKNLNLDGIPNVQFLDLTGNKLSGAQDYSSLKKLLYLAVDNNLITRIDANNISHFQQLSATNNPLFEIHANGSYCLHWIRISGGFVRKRGIVTAITDVREKEQLKAAISYAS